MPTRPIIALVLLLLLCVPTPAREEEEEIPDATLRVVFSNFGEPLEDPTRGRFYLYPPGKRERYAAWGHDGQAVILPEGEYDLVVKYKYDAIQAEQLFEAFVLAGEFEHRVDLEIPVAQLTLDITAGGRPVLVFSGSYTVYPVGNRTAPVARRRPGTLLTLLPGTYDIHVTYRDSEGLKSEWLEDYYLDGFRFETVEMGLPQAEFTLTLLDHGDPVPHDKGLWRVYRPGQRSGYVAERGSGEKLSLEAGDYDIGVFYERDDSTTERWLQGLAISGVSTTQVEMGAIQSLLTVNVTSRGRLLAGSWFSVYAPGDRKTVIASARTGEAVSLDPGNYDIGCFVRDRGFRDERWLHEQGVFGVKDLEVELDTRPASLRVFPRERRSARRRGVRPGLLVLLDGSSNMRARRGSASLLDIARASLRTVTKDPRAAAMNLGLRVFGSAQDDALACQASELLLPLGLREPARLAAAMEGLQPAGPAPLAHALQQVAGDLKPDMGTTLVVLTSGVGDCGGDTCREAAKLVRAGKVARVAVIGLGVGPEQTRRLDCIGRYYAVDTAEGLRAALRNIMRISTRTPYGTVALFNARRSNEWITGGILGDSIGVSAGTYDVLIRTGGRSFRWDDVRIVGNVEGVAGRRAPR